MQDAGLLRVTLHVDVEAALGRELLAAALEGADEGVREGVVRQLVVLEVLRAQVRLLDWQFNRLKKSQKMLLKDSQKVISGGYELLYHHHSHLNEINYPKFAQKMP